MKKIVTTIVFVALTAITTKAQFTRHEFSLYGAGGISTLKYNTNTGDPKTGFGFNTGLGYTFFFSSNWGIGTGVEFSLMNTKYKLSKLDNSYTTNDGTEDFELRHTINGYTENQQAMTVNIPLMLKYQTNGNTKFYAALGGKIGFPVKATYKNKAENISVSGYYPQYDNELFDPEFMGFGEFEVAEKKNDLSLKAMFMLSAEAGVKWRLSESWSLYTGAYIDYGLNDILNETQENQLLVYNNQSPTEYSCNSMLTSRYTEAGNEKVFTDKVIPLSVGLKVALAFGKTPKVKQEQSKAVDKQAKESKQAEVDRLEAEQETLEAKRLADEEVVLLAAQEAEAKRKAEESARAEAERQDSLKKDIERQESIKEEEEHQKTLETKRLADEEVVLLAAQEAEAKRKAEESARAETERQDSLKKETERQESIKEEEEHQKTLVTKRLLEEEADHLRKQENEAKRKAEEIARAETERQENLIKEEERRQDQTKLLIENYSLSNVIPLEFQKAEIDLKIMQMKSDPKLRATITGHTCDIGTNKANLQVGKRRADYAKKYMVERGIDPSRIETISKGSKEPLVPNTSDENRLKNRRIEIVIF